MPIGIDSLGMVLFVRAETGSFARAGLVAAAFGLAIGLSAPALGRLIDYHAHARVMLPLAALHGASLGGLVALDWRARPRARWWPAASRPASPRRRSGRSC